MAGLTLYKASAGSGKTFTLAVQYMKLLIINPYSYRNILAVTFTNKATGEMKERILSQLYALSRGFAESHPYMKILTAELKLPEDEVAQRAEQALRLLVHDYGRFRVETIDSFFQSVLRNLARELELSPNLNIELDTQKVLAEAVESLFLQLEPQSDLMRWILDYIDEKIADDKRWNVLDEITHFGKHLLNEHYMEHGDALRAKLRDPKYIMAFRQLLTAWAKELEEGFRALSSRFWDELCDAGLSPADLSGKERGISSYFRKLEGCEKLSDSDILNTTVAKAIEDPEAWATKTSPRRAEIVDVASTRLIPLLRQAEDYRLKNWKKLLSCRLSLAHIYKVGLLNYIDEEMHEQNHRQNRFLLAETNNLLHSLVKDGDSSFIFEKTGTVIRHIMIDEFQDTSRLQWNNFRLLLTESLSQGADSLIVGDVKQSIYRWRGGDWEILNSLKDRFGPFPIREERLTTNRRSESHIIGFNNLFFTRAVKSLNALYNKELEHDCKELIDAYADVSQQSPRSTPRGAVRVNLLQEKDSEEYTNRTLSELLLTVEELSNRGVAQRDMAILVRVKKHIPAIASWFNQEAPEYRLISDEAFLLQSSVAVGILVDALRCLVSRKDTVSLATLAYRWQREIKRNEVSLSQICTPQDRGSVTDSIAHWLPEGWNTSREALYSLPLHELLERLFLLFSLHEMEGQDAYLMAFFDGVDDYLQRNDPNPEAFLTYWDESLSTRAIPSGELDGIRILSIHASKGLEFHSVLIPFCDWELQSSTHGELVWCAPKEEPFNAMDLIPVSFSKKMADSIYHAEYEHERLQQWVDNLNLLYVAFTRASANLVVWSRQNGENKMGSLLYQALEKFSARQEENGSEEAIPLPVTPTEEEDETLRWDCGDPEFLSSEAIKKPAADTSLPLVPINIFTADTQSLLVKMASCRPRMEFRQSNRSATFIASVEGDAAPAHDYIQRGQLMHTLFSSIRTAQDLEPALQRLLFEGVVSREEAAEAHRLAIRALSHPQVQQWYDGSCRLYNECAILYSREGKTETRRPDRVMETGGRFVVVDFKFGTPRPQYEDQVREYMDLLRRMGHTHVEGYLWYVYTNEIRNVE